MRLLKSSKFWLSFIVTILFLIPFLWLKPNEMDLGGDSSRLYFYDPLSYLFSTVLYAVQPYGFRPEDNYVQYLPFTVLLLLLKIIIPSSYLLITLFNSVKLVAAFLGMYGVFCQLFESTSKRKKMLAAAAIVTALMYVFSPVMVRASWDKAIMSQSQFFLNPVMFFLMLKYVKTKKIIFLLIFAVLSFVFSGNFSWGGAPPFFSFYPIAIVFLIFYNYFIVRTKFNIKPLLLWFLMMLTLHAFHIIPLVIQILGKTGTTFANAFTTSGMQNGLSYFLGTATSVTASKSWLGLPQLAPVAFSFGHAFVIMPILIVFSFFLNSQKKLVSVELKRVYLLVLFFFLLTFYLVTAHITNIGFDLYKLFFSIPGFTMFRNYYGQWMHIYTFFMVILVGSFFYFYLQVVKKTFFRVVPILAFTVLILASSTSFIRGDMINPTLNPGNAIEFKVPLKMDPEYEKFLAYLRTEKIDAKTLTLPFTESFYQMLGGTQNGMYQGPSTISYLANRSDFVGYQVIFPFNENLLETVKDGDTKSLLTLLSIMNIKYIFYNSDERILKNFPFFPYQHVKEFFPKTNAEYTKFLGSLPISKKATFGNRYHYFEIDDKYYLPHIYTAKKLEFYNHQENEWGILEKPFYKNNVELRTAYLDNKFKEFGNIAETPKIVFSRINPTKYRVTIYPAKKPFLLVMSDAYSSNWKLYKTKDEIEGSGKSYFSGNIVEEYSKMNWPDLRIFENIGKKEIAGNTHFVVNGYANGWYLTPQDMGSASKTTFILEMTTQRNMYIGIAISVVSLIICLFFIGMLGFELIKKRNGHKKK